MKEKLKKWLPSRRKLIQLYCALLFNANLKGFISGNIYTGQSKKFCAPGINCYSCPGAIAACPLGSLQGSISADRSTLYYVGGILLLYAIAFGRMICGWACPFGLIQELVYKIKTPKLKKSPVTRLLSYLKYVILVFFVIIVPVVYAFRDTPLPAFCKYICPAGTIEGGLLLLSNKVNESYFSMLGPIFTWKFTLMISIILGCVFVFRLFCRFLCPLGALYGLFNRISIFGITVEESKCTQCGLCLGKCKMDIRHVGDAECIGCGECADVCPTRAIHFKGFKAPEPGSQLSRSRAQNITRWVVTLLLTALLVGVVAFYWFDGAPLTSDPVPTDPSLSDPVGTDPVVGNAIGNLCPGYDLEVVPADSSTVDPSGTGAVTVINFWGTWCTPCVNELPYFDRIAREYPENVTVIAIHSALNGSTAETYVLEHYPDSPIVFALDYSLDTSGLVSEYYTSLGGRGTYPYTVVLDENGVIDSIFVAPLTYDELKAAVDAALEN